LSEYDGFFLSQEDHGAPQEKGKEKDKTLRRSQNGARENRGGEKREKVRTGRRLGRTDNSNKNNKGVWNREREGGRKNLAPSQKSGIKIGGRARELYDVR